MSSTSCDQRSAGEDVHLRDVQPHDLPILFAQQSDPDANRMAVTNPRTFEAFEAVWSKVLADPDRIAKAIVVGGAVVGNINCFKRDGLDFVGYWIAKEHWGRGIASRALSLLLESPTPRPLHARAARSNGASMRILEKCGFRVTGYQFSPATERFPACEEAHFVLD